MLWIALAKLAVHLYAGQHYGYLRDELYYLDCGRHLSWGYVDQPPLIAFLAWLLGHTIGEALWAIRLLPALAGAAEVMLTGLLARELGGRAFAQTIAALAVFVAPGILGVDNLFSMNAFEPLFWTACALLLMRIVNTGDQRLWLWIGVLCGFGLNNKHSMLIFGAGLVLGMLLTPLRASLAQKWIWIAGAIAFVIFLPNLWWNIQHHFPFVEEQANIRRSGRDVALSPLAFFGQATLAMHPLTLPLWLAGLWFYFTAAGRRYRALGWAWTFTALVVVTVSPRVYYLLPAFPVLFAAGGVLCDALPGWRRIAWPVAMVVGAVIGAPFAIPILPPETYIAYAKALHFDQPRIETHKLGPLPQLYADQFGWPEMTEAIANVYNSLPPEMRAKTAIFGQNYGEAAAIAMFGPKYGLPAAICTHQSYFLWGPRGYTGESVIVINGDRADLERRFAEVHYMGQFTHPYSMPFEHVHIFYCVGMKRRLAEVWPQMKKWN